MSSSEMSAFLKKLEKRICCVENGGSLTLDEISDVNATSPTDTYVLTYDAATNTWIAAAASGGGGAASWQTVAHSVGAAGLDLSSDYWAYVTGGASFNDTIIDTSTIQTGVRHLVLIENTTGGQITVTHGTTAISNLGATTVLDSGEWLRLEVFDDANGDVHIVGGIGV